MFVLMFYVAIKSTLKVTMSFPYIRKDLQFQNKTTLNNPHVKDIPSQKENYD